MARKRLFRLAELEPVADRVLLYLAEIQAQSGRRFVRRDYLALVAEFTRRFGPPRITVGLMAESLLLLCRQKKILVHSERFVGEGLRRIYVLVQPEKEIDSVVDTKEPGEPNPAAGGGIEAGNAADDHHSIGRQPQDPGGVAGGVPDLADLAGSGIPGLAGIGAESGYAELCR